MKILMVLTSHDALGDTGAKTGLWLEEFVAPYYTFLDAGAEVTVASPAGGTPPIDPKSNTPEGKTELTTRFKDDPHAMAVLDNTQELASVKAHDFDAVFYPGGHGPMWDLAEDPTSIALLEAFAAAGKPIAAVCHGPAALRHVKLGGKSIIDGRRVTGFSNTEEAAVGLTKVVPFLLEDALKSLGGRYEKSADWQSFAITDHGLTTGQNPISSVATAQGLLQQILARHAA